MKLLKTFWIFLIPFTLTAQNYYGGIPALFDDFSYTNTQFPISGDSSNSLYGKNIWLTENGTISSRAWNRYNSGNPDNFGANSELIARPPGIQLRAFKGFRIGDITPIFNSGFIFKEGTYVSKVKFSELPRGTATIEAFWLGTPDSYRFANGKGDSITYVAEVDIEWNNYFGGRGNDRVHFSNLFGHIPGAPLPTGKGDSLIFFKKDELGRMIKLGADVNGAEEFFFQNRWYYCLIRVDSASQTTSVMLESTEEDNPVMDKVYGGSSLTDAGTVDPLVLKEYYPRYPLGTIYSFGISPLDPAIKTLPQEMGLNTDWFYYTPLTDVDIAGVLKEIENFRKQNIPRINTTGKPLMIDLSAPHTAVIEGVENLRRGKISQWILKPSTKNTGYDIDFTYRFKNGNTAGEWIFITDDRITLKAESDVDTIEFKAVVTNYWTREVVTVEKIVRVLP